MKGDFVMKLSTQNYLPYSLVPVNYIYKHQKIDGFISLNKIHYLEISLFLRSMQMKYLARKMISNSASNRLTIKCTKCNNELLTVSHPNI